MLEFLKYIFFPAIAIIVSIYTIYRNDTVSRNAEEASRKASEKAEEASRKANEKAEESSRKSQEATDLANRINNGQIEISIATLITQTENRVADISIEMGKYIANKETLSKSELVELGFYEGAYKQAIQSNLNAYEEACAKYIDKKVDTERFKRMYDRPIRRIVEEDEFKAYFDAVVKSPYKCILKVYDEWYNHEK